jgi:hypothetical protein
MNTGKHKLVTKRDKLIAKGKQGELTVMDGDTTIRSETCLTEAMELCRLKLASLANMPMEELAPNDLYKIMIALTGASRGLCEIEKWRCERQGMFKDAEKNLKARIKMELGKYPELVAQFHEVVGQVVAEANNKTE